MEVTLSCETSFHILTTPCYIHGDDSISDIYVNEVYINYSELQTDKGTYICTEICECILQICELLHDTLFPAEPSFGMSQCKNYTWPYQYVLSTPYCDGNVFVIFVSAVLQGSPRKVLCLILYVCVVTSLHRRYVFVIVLTSVKCIGCVSGCQPSRDIASIIWRQTSNLGSREEELRAD
jgi:hypothetical protein